MDTKLLFQTAIGRLRVLGFLEGLSFVVLVFVGMPLKYFLDSPWLVKQAGMAHGLLFVAFVIYTILVSVDLKWSFSKITWKLLLSSIIPFGPFIADHKILKPLAEQDS